MIAQQSSALAAQMGSGAHASRVLHLAGHQMLIPARVPLSGDHSQIWHSESAYHQAHKKFGKVKQGKASISTPPGGGGQIISAKIARSITLSKLQTIGSKLLATNQKLKLIIQDHENLPQKMPNLPPKNAIFALSRQNQNLFGISPKTKHNR